MMISCPKCLQKYPLEHISLGSQGRKVRCSICAEIWFQRPVASKFGLLKKSILTSQKNIQAVERRFSQQRAKPKKRFFLVKMILGLLFFGGLGYGFYYLFQTFFIDQKIEVVFKEIIKTVQEKKPRGVEIYYVTVKPEESFWPENGVKQVSSDIPAHSHPNHVVKLSGDVVNNSSDVQDLPVLKIYLKGKCLAQKGGPKQEECVLQSWNYALAQPRILPGESIHFEISLKPKSQNNGYYRVSF